MTTNPRISESGVSKNLCFLADVDAKICATIKEITHKSPHLQIERRLQNEDEHDKMSGHSFTNMRCLLKE